MNQRKKKVDRLTFLGTLAGGLAHEIKNPLSTISLNLQLLKEDWEDSDGARERKSLKRIEILNKEIARLEGIVNDFLTYARGFSLQPVPESINQIITDMVTFLDPEARRQGIEIRTFLDPASPAVLVDVKYIKLAFLNIIQNALQALEEVTGIKEVMVRTNGLPSGVEVTVTDTGSGIAEEHRNKIFQVYFSTKRKGTGMGLPTVKRIIEEHNGSVYVQSEEGKGTSFRVVLPSAGPESSSRDKEDS